MNIAKLIMISIFLSLFIFTACAPSSINFQATWYIIERANELNDKSNSECSGNMYLALLNQGKDEVEIAGIVLNPVENDKKGWAMKAHNNFTLDAGEVKFLCVTDFYKIPSGENWGSNTCRVPVSMIIKTTKASFAEEHFLEVIGAMPTSVPENWETNCRFPPKQK